MKISFAEMILSVLGDILSALPWGDRRNEARDRRGAIIFAVVFLTLVIVAIAAYFGKL